jgi:thiamine-triphosphatase
VGLLSSAGVWVRQRNGTWQAKVKRSGNFTNFSFEELSDPHQIPECSTDVTSVVTTEQDRFGLGCIAAFSTTQRAWRADGEFTIVLDNADFGHTVGEVELQRELSLEVARNACIEEKKPRMMHGMDEKIASNMEHRLWVLCQGPPVGRLTAYFARRNTWKYISLPRKIRVHQSFVVTRQLEERPFIALETFVVGDGNDLTRLASACPIHI